ncbi:TetR/AcrR family transcriptional regulator [Rubrivirga sp.]|uniref:TetR/AcrR family transcriptional regulator n=1 Tax=Rubrivirga sp. TaxID=1885344 RepID=UPI003C752455
MIDDVSQGPPLPRKRPQQERSRITVEAVLEAAAQVLEAGGYAGLTTTAVAERAGVSIGTLYQYFPDKDAVVAGLVEDWIENEARSVRRAFEDVESLDLEDAIAPLIEAFVSVFSGRTGRSAAVLHGALWVRWRPALDDLLGDMVEGIAGRLRRSPSRAGTPDPGLVAYVATHAVVGVVIRALVERPEDLESGAVTREATRLVRGYLGGKPDLEDG